MAKKKQPQHAHATERNIQSKNSVGKGSSLNNIKINITIPKEKKKKDEQQKKASSDLKKLEETYQRFTVVRNELKDANVQVPQAVARIPKMDTTNPEAVPKMTQALQKQIDQMQSIQNTNITSQGSTRIRNRDQQTMTDTSQGSTIPQNRDQQTLTDTSKRNADMQIQKARQALATFGGKKTNVAPMSAAERDANAGGIRVITGGNVPNNATSVEPKYEGTNEYSNPIFDEQGTQQEITTDIDPSTMEPRSEPLAPEGTNDIEPSVLDNVGAFNEEAMPDGPIEEVEKLSPVLDKIAEVEEQGVRTVSQLATAKKSVNSLGNTFRGNATQIGSPSASNQTSPLETPPSSAERPSSTGFRPTRPNNQNTKPNTDSPGLGTSEDSAEQSVAELGEDIRDPLGTSEDSAEQSVAELGEDIRKPVETSMNSSEEFDELGEDTLIRDPFGTMERESVVNLGEVFPNEQPDPQTSQPEDNSIPSDGDLTTADKIRELQNQYNELYRSSTPETLSNSEIGGKLGDITNQLIALGGYSAIPLGTIQSQQPQPSQRTIGNHSSGSSFFPRMQNMLGLP